MTRLSRMISGRVPTMVTTFMLGGHALSSAGSGASRYGGEQRAQPVVSRVIAAERVLARQSGRWRSPGCSSGSIGQIDVVVAALDRSGSTPPRTP